MGQGSSTCPSSCNSFEVPRQIDNGGRRVIAGGGCGNSCHVSDVTLCLPDECLAMVFGKLGCHDRNSCSLVCRRWRLVDAKSRQRIVLLARSEMSPFLPALLSRFSSVTVLSLKCSRKFVSIDDEALACIPVHLSALRKLKLKGCIDVSDNGLQAFALHRPPLLNKLSFASCGFGARGLISLLSNCPTLQDLTLKRLRKLDAQNIPLSLDLDENKKHHHCNTTYQRLERLCLKDLHNARLFIPLLCSPVCVDLKSLVVSRSSGSWDKVLENFHGKTTAISEIQMDNVQIGDAGLIAISEACPDLEVLYLCRPTDCTDDGLSAVANSCKKLRKLHVDAWSRFGSRTIGDLGVFSVANKCSQLQELVLLGVPVTVASLNVLASNCPSLERMALCNTDSIGNSEMAFIAAKFPALEKLCIKNCAITDDGIEAIGEGCPSLVKLKVKRCKGVTQAGVSKLRRQRSSLVVSVDSGLTLFYREGVVGDAGEEEDEGITNRNRMPTSAIPNTRNTSTTTDVICSSRGATLLRSKFETALQLGRRRPHDPIPHSRQPPSAHAVAASRNVR